MKLFVRDRQASATVVDENTGFDVIVTEFQYLVDGFRATIEKKAWGNEWSWGIFSNGPDGNSLYWTSKRNLPTAIACIKEATGAVERLVAFGATPR